MELYLSDHPARLRVVSRERPLRAARTWPEALGVTGTRYGLTGANHHARAEGRRATRISRSIQSMCIVCSRCVRACDEVQGTFALTIQGRGFGSKVAASQNEPFLASECVSCGACVEACPTGALAEKSLIQIGRPIDGDDDHVRVLRRRLLVQRRSRGTTRSCAWCPNRDGHANHGHACVKGRFAFGYATHPDRITTPMIRKSIDDPWQQVSWEVAIGHAASEFQPHPGELRPRLDRRHHVVALHERRDVPRAEAGARGVRQQQRRHLRARLPFADRLRPEEHHRRIRRHAGLRLGA